MTCPNYTGLVLRNKIKCRFIYSPGNVRTAVINFSPSNFSDYPYAYTYATSGRTSSISTLKPLWTPVSVCPVNYNCMLTRADAIAHDIHSRVTVMSIKQFPYTVNPRSSTIEIIKQEERFQAFLPHQHFSDEDTGAFDVDTLPLKWSVSSIFHIIPNTMGRYDVGWTIARPWPWNDQNLSNYHIPLSVLHAFYYGNVSSGNLIQRAMVYEVTYIVETMFKDDDIGLGWYSDSRAVRLELNVRALELYNKFTFFDFPDLDSYFHRINSVSREFNLAEKSVRRALFPSSDDPYLFEVFSPERGLLAFSEEEFDD